MYARALIPSNSRELKIKLAGTAFIYQWPSIGLHAKAGRSGGAYAHRDIAFEFGSWLSPEFKLYLFSMYLVLTADTRVLNLY